VSPEPHEAQRIVARPMLGFLGLWVPILVLESYLAFTVFLYFFGPVEWNIPSTTKLLSFLAVNYGGLYLGYLVGVRRDLRSLQVQPSRYTGVLRVNPLLLRLITVSMLFTIFSTLGRLFAIRGGFSEVIATLSSPGEAYIQAQLIAQMDRDGVAMPIQQHAWIFRVSTLFAVLSGLYFPLSVACWRWLPRSLRLLFWAALGSSLIYAVGIGAQSGVGFLLFSVLPVLVYKIFVERKALRISLAPVLSVSRPRSKAKLVATGVASVLMLAATVAFFQLDRAESSGHELTSGDALVGQFGTSTSRGFPLFEDGRLGFGIVMASKYVSHGYTGLALAMEIPFEWTYGIGWSKGLQVMVRDYLGGPDVFQKSYLVRNEATNDWPALFWWSTIFPWIASDTTFFGTVLVMLLVGFGIGRLWTDIIVSGDPLGFALLGQLFVLVFMFPANNALAQTMDGVFALIGGLLVYFVGRRWRWRFAPRGPVVETGRAAVESGRV
jgi:hypothetical protein